MGVGTLTPFITAGAGRPALTSPSLCAGGGRGGHGHVALSSDRYRGNTDCCQYQNSYRFKTPPTRFTEKWSEANTVKKLKQYSVYKIFKRVINSLVYDVVIIHGLTLN